MVVGSGGAGQAAGGGAAHLRLARPEADKQKTMQRSLAARDWSLFPLYSEVEKGDGRVEKRAIQLTPHVSGIRFPYAAQGFRIDRTTTLSNGKTRHEVVFGVTSIAPDRAGEREILHLVRGHWNIEAVQHIRDVTYDDYAALTIMPNRGAVSAAPSATPL